MRPALSDTPEDRLSHDDAHFGVVVSKFGFCPDMKSTYGNRGKEKLGNSGVKCKNVMNLYESRTTWRFVNAKSVPLGYII